LILARPRDTAYAPAEIAAPIAAYRGGNQSAELAKIKPTAVATVATNSVVFQPGFNAPN
jgi:hypothetical protein